MRDDRYLNISRDLLGLLHSVWRMGMERFEGARPQFLAVWGDATSARRIEVMRWEGAAWLLAARVHGQTLEDFMALPLTGPAMFDIAMAEPRRRALEEPGRAMVSPLSFGDVHTRLGLAHPLDRLTERGSLPLVEYLLDRNDLCEPVGRIDACQDGDGVRIFGADVAEDASPVVLDEGLDESTMPASFEELARWSGVVEDPDVAPNLDGVLVALMGRIVHWGGLITFNRDGWTTGEVRTRLLVEQA